MKFLNDYKKGGDKADDVGQMGGYIYLSKKHAQDLDLELRRGFIKISERPETKGDEKLIMEFEVKRVGDDCEQDELEAGDIVSVLINLTPSNDLAREKAAEEFIRILSALTGVREHEYYKSIQETTKSKPSLPEQHLEDDLAVGQGTVVTVTTPEPANSKGWYNLEWTTKELSKAAKKAAA